MAFRRSLVQPQFADLKGILAQSKETDNALYQTVEALIERLVQLQAVTVEEATRVAAVTGPGDVMGPAASTDNDIALFSGITGKIIKDSGILIGRVPLLDLANAFTDIQHFNAGFEMLDPVLGRTITLKYGTGHGLRLTDPNAVTGSTEISLIYNANNYLNLVYNNNTSAATLSVIAGGVIGILNLYTSVLFLHGGQLKFPVTQIASADANTLDDYEEGTWTIGDGSGAGLVFTGVTCRYVKVGRIVYASAQFSYPVTANGLAAVLNGFPFTCGDIGGSGSDRYPPAAGFATVYRYMRENQAFMQLYLASGAAYTNAQMSATNHNIDVVYRSAN